MLAWVLVGVAMALWCGLVGQHVLVRYQSYRADAFDLGNMDQAVWNTLHGHPFRFTNRGLDSLGPPTRLAIHVEPILLLIAPLYLIHSGPETLLLLQTGALACGALPLFLLGLRRLPNLPLLAAAIAITYLLTPEVLGAALWDFHPVALATPLLLLALWALDARRFAVFGVAALLAALTKEDVALSLLPLGLYVAFWLRRPRLGAGVTLLALLWVALCFFVILPHNAGSATGGNTYWYRYAWLGATPRAALANLAAHPWLPLTYVLGSPARRGYLALLLRTSGGLGILAPALWLCALPEVAVNVFSAHWEQYSGFYHYNAMLGAYLPAATVYGLAAMYRARCQPDALASAPTNREPKSAAGVSSLRWPALASGARRALAIASNVALRWRHALARVPLSPRWIGPLAIAWLLVTGAWNLSTIGPRLSDFWNAGSGTIAHQAQVDALLARIPATASVAATDSLDPHLSDRYALYLLPDPQAYSAEYVAVDLADLPPITRAEDQQIYERMRASGHYTVVGSVDTVVVLHRVGAPLRPAAENPT